MDRDPGIRPRPRRWPTLHTQNWERPRTRSSGAEVGEWIVSLVSNEALARVVGWRPLEDMPMVLHCRVRRGYLTRRQVFEVVETWSRTDAARGRPMTDAEKLPEPHWSVYMLGYRQPPDATV